MKLKFYARGDALVTIPNEQRIVGNPAEYVGRKRIKEGDNFAYPATRDPFVCPPEMAPRLAKLTRRDNSLWPADKETAQACGVGFKKVEYSGGEWIPEIARSKQTRADK